jgi:hypothetical protein
MAEPLLSLLQHTEATLRAKAQCAATAQLDDRADQCGSWARNVERWGDHIPKGREDEMRDACAEFLRMCGE